jgi:hypothetical protein
MVSFLRPKFIARLIWFGFGLFGLIIIFKQYFPQFWPKLQQSNLVKGVQGELIKTVTTSDSSGQSGSVNPQLNLQDLDPQEAGEVIAKVVSQQITELIKESTVQIKEFPAKQVQKIKIGACEDLLEEDICSVASELHCGEKQD